jgi:membrane-associated protease RseP (regulator of RpoE activity)
VVVDENGDPIAGARLASGRVPTYLPLGELPVGVVVSDRRGKFVLGGLEEGDHAIEAYKVGYGRSARSVKVRPGDTTSGIEIELVEDPDVDLTRVGAQASLAVTLSESTESGAPVIIFEHVPLRGEAQRAGILAGDRFVAYNGYPIASLEQARRSLNGPISEDFVIELERPPNHRWRVRVRREQLRR